MRVTLVIDGDRCDLEVAPHRTLAQVLHEDRGLSGLHPGCADGTCGTCTVLVDGEAVRSCLLLAVQCDGTHVRTVADVVVDLPSRAAIPAQTPAPCGFCVP